MAAVYERGGVWLAVPRPVPLYQVVRSALLNALAFTNGHQGEAAGLLGLTQRQLTYNLVAYGIPSARPRPHVQPRRASVPQRPQRRSPRLRRVK